MSDRISTSHNADSPKLQGSILRGILGGIVGMLVCILAMVLCWMCQMEELSITFLILAGLIIGWFYRLFRGRRSKLAAYAIVGIFTILACALWIMVVVMLSGGISPARFIKAMSWGKLWSRSGELMLSCAGIGLFVFLLYTKKWLLPYVDWERAPWHIACAYAGGAMYNLLPEKLPAKNPPVYFEVRERFPPKTCIIVEGSTIRWKRLIRKDCVFSVHDIAGVVLGPSGGCNVLYDKNYQLLAKFAGSMKNADLLFLWLLQWNIPMDNVPSGWLSADEVKPDPAPVEIPVPKRKFTLRLKRSVRMGYTGGGLGFLLMGLLSLLAFNFFSMTVAEWWVMGIMGLFEMGLGIIFLRIAKGYRVEIDGEQIRAATRFGRTAKFSVREVSSVAQSAGMIYLYDREWKTLAKLDRGLENLKMLEEYLAFYGVNM